MSKINIIDAVSLISNEKIETIEKIIRVDRPDSFNDIEVYTNSILMELNYKKVFVMLFALHELEQYENLNEIGVFLQVLSNSLKSKNIPEIIIIPETTNLFFNKVMPTYAEETINIGKVIYYS